MNVPMLVPWLELPWKPLVVVLWPFSSIGCTIQLMISHHKYHGGNISQIKWWHGTPKFIFIGFCQIHFFLSNCKFLSKIIFIFSYREKIYFEGSLKWFDLEKWPLLQKWQVSCKSSSLFWPKGLYLTLTSQISLYMRRVLCNS